MEVIETVDKVASDEVKPVAETPLDIVKNDSGQALSKSALKKLAKRQSWLDTKAERKAIQKQKRKAKVEQNKAEGKYEISYSARRKRLKNCRMDLSDCKVNVVIDMSFDDLMQDRDLGKCLKQLMHCYCINRRLADPLQFHVNGLRGRAEAEMQNRHSGFTNWDCNFHSESYVETFTSPPYNKKKSDIIYLSSDSENVIGATLDPDKVYIIGGLVDHNKQKGVCHKKAVENQVSHARLPIDEYIQMKTRKVLTIDHVYQILAKVASEGKSWKEAFLSTLPPRKGAREIGDDNDEDDDDDSSQEDDSKSVADESNNDDKQESAANESEEKNCKSGLGDGSEINDSKTAVEMKELSLKTINNSTENEKVVDHKLEQRNKTEL